MSHFFSKWGDKNTGELSSVDPAEILVHDRKETATILFLAYRHYIKGVALRYAPFSHLADEVVQQVYVEFLGGVEKWDFDGNVKALLAVMTQNIARAHWKSESRNLPQKLKSIAEHICQVAEDEDADRYSDDLHALRECLKKAPEKTGELVKLHYFDGMSFQEIASMMALNPDSVYRAVYRLKEKIRACIERVIKGEEAHV